MSLIGTTRERRLAGMQVYVRHRAPGAPAHEVVLLLRFRGSASLDTLEESVRRYVPEGFMLSSFRLAREKTRMRDGVPQSRGRGGMVRAEFSRTDEPLPTDPSVSELRKFFLPVWVASQGPPRTSS